MTKDEKDNKDQDNGDNVQKRKTSALEWFFAAVGLILVTGVVGFLLYHALTDQEVPPDFSVKVESTIKRENGYLVKFSIENMGSETAADVTVEGELTRGEEKIETSDVTVDYVASRSEKKGGLLFTRDPAGYELKIRAKGYNAP